MQAFFPRDPVAKQSESTGESSGDAVLPQSDGLLSESVSESIDGSDDEPSQGKESDPPSPTSRLTDLLQAMASVLVDGRMFLTRLQRRDLHWL